MGYLLFPMHPWDTPGYAQLPPDSLLYAVPQPPVEQPLLDGTVCTRVVCPVLHFWSRCCSEEGCPLRLLSLFPAENNDQPGRNTTIMAKNRYTKRGVELRF